MKLAEIKNAAATIENIPNLYYNAKESMLYYAGKGIKVRDSLILTFNNDGVYINCHGKEYDGYDEVSRRNIKLAVHDEKLYIKSKEIDLDGDEFFALFKFEDGQKSIFGFLILCQAVGDDKPVAIIPLPNATDFKAICYLMHNKYKETKKIADLIDEINRLTNGKISENDVIVIDVPNEEELDKTQIEASRGEDN